MTPQEYAEKHKLRAIAVAYEHCISENAYRKQFLTTQNKTKPAITTCRISQLLDFIREKGYEPPQPVFFD